MQFCRSRGLALLAAVLLFPVFSYSQTNYGIWVSPSELATLPMSGIAWDKLKQYADADPGIPDLSNQVQNNNVYVLAKALVYARTGIERYRTEVIDQCMRAIDTEVGGSGLALGRELAAYVISADLVKLPADKNEIFRAWLRRTLTEPMLYDGRSLQRIDELRPNNWGLMAGTSRAAVAAYLNDPVELAATAKIFRGWLGERDVYAGFYSNPATEEQSWICDPARPVGINPAGCTKDGHNIDGVLPYDQGRGGPFTWPPFDELYVWEALKGVIVQAEILYRAGYDVYNWSDKAVFRAYRWMYEVNNFPPDPTDLWQPYIVNFRYGTKYPTVTWARFGNNMGWADWTHGPGRTLSVRATDPPPVTVPPSDTTAPTAPANVTVTAVSGTQINLSWTAATDNVGVTGYRLERCEGTTCTSFIQIASPTASSYSDAGLTSGASYRYRVRATDAAGNLGVYSSIASAATPDTVAPTAPSGLTATGISSTQINLSWTAPSDNVGVTGYRLERCQGTGCASFTLIVSPTSTAYSDTSVTAGTSYTYRVRAIDAAGNLGGYSNTASAVTPAPAPPASGGETGGGTESGSGTAGPSYTTVRVEQNKSPVRYSGTWYNNKYSRHSARTATKSPTAGSKAVFTFTGTGVSWIGYRDHSSGIAAVYLDGMKVAEIDTYSPSAMVQPAVYSRTGLSDGVHTITIEATGRKNPESASRWVWVDAFEYTTASPMADTAVTTAVRSATVVSVGDVGLFQVGQAPIRKSDDVAAPAGGFATLRFGSKCSVRSEAGIAASPLRDSGRIYIEQDANLSTGIAFSNPNNELNTVRYFLSDTNGQTIRTGAFDLPPQGQLARFSNEAPFAAPAVWKGTLTFDSALPVAAIAVRSVVNERRDYLFTITTIADLTPVRHDPVFIPHFVDGGAWRNQTILINPVDSVISGTLEFIGTDIPSVQYTIGPGGALNVPTPNHTDTLRTGALRIVPSGSSPAPAATSILSYRVNGIILNEVSLPEVDTSRGFTLFAEKGTNLFAGAPSTAETGIAVVNTGETTLVQFELIAGGHTQHVGQLELPPHSHRALYLSQIPGFQNLPEHFTGVLRVNSSTSEVSVVGVRTAWDECSNVMFSSVPAVNDDLVHPNSRYIFPHFAFGSGFSTRFIIFGNPEGQPGTLDFYSSSGAVLTPPQ